MTPSRFVWWLLGAMCSAAAHARSVWLLIVACLLMAWAYNVETRGGVR